MSEEKMVELVRDALRERGIEHEVVAAGQFNPRGHSGPVRRRACRRRRWEPAWRHGRERRHGCGSVAGMRAADAASGLPAKMLVGASASTV
jgi:hypothetical protein